MRKSPAKIRKITNNNGAVAHSSASFLLDGRSGGLGRSDRISSGRAHGRFEAHTRTGPSSRSRAATSVRLLKPKVAAACLRLPVILFVLSASYGVPIFANHSYGRHKSVEELKTMTAASEETVAAVSRWLESIEVFRARLGSMRARDNVQCAAFELIRARFYRVFPAALTKAKACGPPLSRRAADCHGGCHAWRALPASSRRRRCVARA